MLEVNKVTNKVYFKRKNVDKILKEQKDGLHNKILVQESIMHGTSTLRHLFKKWLPQVNFAKEYC